MPNQILSDLIGNSGTVAAYAKGTMITPKLHGKGNSDTYARFARAQPIDIKNDCTINSVTLRAGSPAYENWQVGLYEMDPSMSPAALGAMVLEAKGLTGAGSGVVTTHSITPVSVKAGYYWAVVCYSDESNTTGNAYYMQDPGLVGAQRASAERLTTITGGFKFDDNALDLQVGPVGEFIALPETLGSFTCFCFNGDETELYLVDNSAKKIIQYTLSVAGDPSSYQAPSRKEFSYNGLISSVDQITMADSDSKVYLNYYANAQTKQFNLSVAGDITTATDSVYSWNPAYHRGFTFSSSGAYAYAMGNSASIHRITCPTPFSLNGTSYTSVAIGSVLGSSDLRSITLMPDDKTFVIHDTINKKAALLTLDVANDLSSYTVGKGLPLKNPQMVGSKPTNGGAKVLCIEEGAFRRYTPVAPLDFSWNIGQGTVFTGGTSLTPYVGFGIG